MSQPLQLIACGVLVGSGTPAWAGRRIGFTSTVVDTGTGDWTVNLGDHALLDPDEENDIITIGVVGTAGRAVNYDKLNASQIRFTGWDLATPTAADVTFSVKIERIAVPG